MNEHNDFDQFSSKNAEQSVLGALMSRNEVLDDLSFLKQEHFADDANRLIFNVICKQIAHGKTSDPISIFDALQSANRLGEVGGMEYINALATSVAGGYAAKHWAQILVDKHQLRAVRNMAVALNEAVCKRGMSGEVSTHATRAGRDGGGYSNQTANIRFNSRDPCGSRRARG